MLMLQGPDVGRRLQKNGPREWKGLELYREPRSQGWMGRWGEKNCQQHLDSLAFSLEFSKEDKQVTRNRV